MVILYTDKTAKKKLGFNYSDLSFGVFDDQGNMLKKIEAQDVLSLLINDNNKNLQNNYKKIEEIKNELKKDEFWKKVDLVIFNYKIKESAKMLEKKKKFLAKLDPQIVLKDKRIEKFDLKAVERTVSPMLEKFKNFFLLKLNFEFDVLVSGLAGIVLDVLHERFFKNGSIPSALEVHRLIKEIVESYKEKFLSQFSNEDDNENDNEDNNKNENFSSFRSELFVSEARS